MKKTATLLICLILAFSLSGCLSGRFRVEPKEDNSTLLLAHVKLIAYGFDGPYGHNGDIINGIDGEYKNSLMFTLHNLEQNRSVQITAKATKRGFGLVYDDKLPEGKYQLLGVFFKKEVQAGSYIYTYRLGDRSNLIFDIEKGKVNNLGELVIHYYKEASSSKFHGKSTISSNAHYEHNINYLEVENWFKEKYPESLWNEIEWTNTQFGEIVAKEPVTEE